MSTTHLLLRLIHIGFGTAVLLLLWTPLSTRKGGRTHRRGGRLYLWAGRVVVASALVSCVWTLARLGGSDYRPDQNVAVTNLRFFFSVLGVLGLIALSDMERGVFVISRATGHRARQWLTSVAAVSGAGSVALAGWGLVALTSGPLWHGLVRIGIGAVGLDTARRTLAIGRATIPISVQRQSAHVEAMLGSAAAFYTGFAVFGFGRLIGTKTFDGGPLAFLPWVVPSVGFVLLTAWWKQRLASRISVAPATS